MDIYANMLRFALLGLGATAAMDLWALLLKRLFGLSSADYAMVGRWLGHMPKGRFRHRQIAAAAPIPGEAALGWTVHYGVGLMFGLAFGTFMGSSWLHQPTLLPAVFFGLGTVVMPFCLMQPAFGAGFAASNTPNPNSARLRSLHAHLSFGVGLYVAALALPSL
jgi:hypothetical protein